MTSQKSQDIQCIRQYIRDCDHKPEQRELTGARILDPTRRPLVDRTGDEVQPASYRLSPISQQGDAVQATPFSPIASTPRVPSRPPTAQTPTNTSTHGRTPLRRSPRLSTPSSQTYIRPNRPRTPTPAVSPLQEEAQSTNDDDLDDIGDGLDGEEIFPRWEEYLSEVLEDDELGSAFVAPHSDSYHNWEFEMITPPDTTPFPEADDPQFPQEKGIGGIRAVKSSLSAMFSGLIAPVA
ncbi:hypothetical protein F441_03714 [Phytophthora nicotianae CJ01A1]|uniref:Uncharacterized protein n=1 Tax=Phytophthora nicotianae CJ01A1 TaxID=1317063 RepID=W2XKA8_PHYNI|nr:hypothetical protein F441_03714 [Phytophthora nicotianae CJ01A1]